MKSPLNSLGISLREQLRDFVVQVWGVRYLVSISFGGRGSAKVNGVLDPINFGVPFLEPGHSKNDLRLRESYNHEFHCVREGS